MSFKNSSKWEEWLERNHSNPEGIWLRIFKKDSGKQTLSYAEALDVALCYGWIDGLKKSFDTTSWIQKFTPRRPRSMWSRINTGHAERLLKLGKVRPSGQAAIEAARQDGRWIAAYDSPSKAVIPSDFLKHLAKNKKAKSFFKTLNRTNRYSITWRLQTAKKPETRARRIAAIIEMLAAGKKFHG